MRLHEAVDRNPDPAVVEIDLEARVADVSILPGAPTPMWTYDGGVPGPLIRARRGDRLVPRSKLSPEIAVLGKPEIDGRVVHAMFKKEEIGGNDVVYLNRGANEGLQVGSPLEVYRPIGTAIDEAQSQERQLPDDVIARLLVVQTTETTATAVVVKASTEIEPGDTFRGADGIQ